MSRFTGRLWKWVVPAGIMVGLLGLWVPAGADDKKEVEKDPEIKSVKVRAVEITKDGDEDRKEGTRKEVKKEGERKEEGRKGESSGDARIDELTKIVKQLAGQVNELREEIRGQRGGFAGGPNPEEMRKRMEEMAKKFAAGNPGAVNTEKYREEMERRLKEQGKFAREGGAFGADAEAQIRREIERLNAQLKQIIAAREEGTPKIDKKEPKKEGDRKEGDKEGGDKKEVKKDGDKEDGDKKDDKEEGDKKEDKKPDDK